ncbi:MAG: MazG-like family protein [Minisyncoccia bacterium]
MKSLEKEISKYLKDRHWDDLCPADLAKSIMIEGAELLELFQWENLSLEEVKKNKEKIEEIKKELADVIIYGLEMSVLFGFDTKKIVLKKLAHINKKYPAKLMREVKKGEKKDNAHYYKIKKEYRKNRK